MALPLNITINVTGEANAKDYKYVPSMSVFDSGGIASSEKTNKVEDSSKSKDEKLNSIPTQLYIPYALKLTRADIVKGGEFVDPKKITDKDLLRALGSQASAIRMLDYAEARSGNKSVDLKTSMETGLLAANVELITQLIFKNGKNLKLQGEVYTIYQNKMVSWKLIPKTSRNKERVSVVMDISVARGKSINFTKRQRLSCPGRRANLRESIKEVIGRDLLGEPAKKPLKVIPRRLFQPTTSSSRSRSSSSSYSRYPSREYMRRMRQLYPYGYGIPYGYGVPPPPPPPRRPSESTTERRSQVVGGKQTLNKKRKNKTRKMRNMKTRKLQKSRKNYVLENWYI